MTDKEYYEKREAYQARLNAEYETLQRWAKENGCSELSSVDFERSKYWFRVETMDYCQIYGHYFSCKDANSLKDAIRHICRDTIFYDVTAFIENCSYVTFCSEQDLDRTWNYYYAQA